MAEPNKTPTSAESESEKSKESIAPMDLEDFDGASEDDLSLSLEDQLATKKMATRRKIEMYWEKKRLQDQLGDFEEVDLDF